MLKMQNIQNEVNWRLTCMDFELLDEYAGMTIEDFILGKFDEECLGEFPPESDRHIPAGDWSDWFPPPPRMTEWEHCELTDWVEIEAEKHDLVPNPDNYPLRD